MQLRIRRRGITVLLAAVATVAPAAEKPFHVEECTLDGVAGPARCGTVVVPEDRRRPDGRQLRVPFVVLPALGEPAEDAVVFLAGGPGDSATAHAAGIAQYAAALREHRDFLMVDVRGTGGPDALACPELKGDRSLAGFLTDFYPPEPTRRCRERLEPAHDLAAFTTDAAADDVEAVRAALGYERLDLDGASYGTRLALVYLRRHPERVRTVTLTGVDPTDERGPLHYAHYAQDALDATFAACRAEGPCAAAFPDLDGDLAAALAQLDRQPAHLELPDPAGGPPIALDLTRAGFAQALRYALYIPATAFQVPLGVHLAAQGNFRPIAEIGAMFFRLAAGNSADGFYLSATCSEDVPFIADAEIPAAVAGTFLGDFRIRQQRAACALWPAEPVDRSFLEPVRSDAPVLVFSGARDPVTPARRAEAALATLPSALHVVIPDGAHDVSGLSGLDCLDEIATRFVESGTTKGLDTSCVQEIHRPPFPTALPGADAPQLSAEELARYAGRFRSEEGLELAIVRTGDRLRLELPGKPPMLLTPLAADRFGIEGLPPGFALQFERDGSGTPAAVTLEEGGGEGMRLVRVPVD